MSGRLYSTFLCPEQSLHISGDITWIHIPNPDTHSRAWHQWYSTEWVSCLDTHSGAWHQWYSTEWVMCVRLQVPRGLQRWRWLISDTNREPGLLPRETTHKLTRTKMHIKYDSSLTDQESKWYYFPEISSFVPKFLRLTYSNGLGIHGESTQNASAESELP